MKQIFYHGTSEEHLREIKSEGVLFGKREVIGGNYHPDRCTYLTPYLKEAECYGNVILEVVYDIEAKHKDNFIKGCWQFRTYDPIPLADVKVIKINKKIRKATE